MTRATKIGVSTIEKATNTVASWDFAVPGRRTASITYTVNGSEESKAAVFLAHMALGQKEGSLSGT